MIITPMKMTDLRKYEITFLILATLLITFASNLPYYTLFFYSPPNFQFPELSSAQKFYRIIWYTCQIEFSILFLSFFNYYWIRFLLAKKSLVVLNILLIMIYNSVLAVLLFKASYFLGEIAVGHPISERFAFNYYLWKFVYITPASIALALILKLVIRKREVELNNARLVEENLSNQLKSLKDQVKPHFLFNTLNTLSELIRNQSREEGLKFVDDLSVVYRYILEQSNHDLVDLRVELNFAQSYLRLLKRRFYNKFNSEISIEEKYLTYQIPPLTFLLLIENTIKHNEFTDRSPLMITIDIDRNEIRVENNLLPKTSDSSGLGIGLQNLNKRYVLLTGKEVVINKSQGKFTVRLPLINDRTQYRS